MQVPHGTQFLDLNLLPPRFRPRHFPAVPATLGFLLAIGVVLLLVIGQLKGAVDADVTKLRAELRVAQEQVTGPEQQDLVGTAASLANYNISWSRVLQSVLASAPTNVQLQDIAFTVDAKGGPQAVIKGQGAEYPAIVEYADNLRSSPLFSRISIQSMGEAPPVTGSPTPNSSATASAGSGQAAVTPTPTRSPSSIYVPPPPQILYPTPTPSTQSSPTPSVRPIFVITTVTPMTGTTTATPARPRSSSDFMVVQRDMTCDSSAPMDFVGNLVAGSVLDTNGGGMAGIGLRVTSTNTATPWSADTVTDGQGNYYFWLTKADYQVQVLTGSSDVASDLWTRSTQETGVCTWKVSFQKNINKGTPTVQQTSTRTATTTRTASPSITPTPPAGTVVYGTATASSNPGDAGLAIDGNPNTVWNAGNSPNQYWEESFSSAYSVTGINLIISQNPSGNTTQIIHFYTGAVEIPNSALTLTGYTFEGQELSQSFATPISGVNRVRIETTDGPSYVAWREVKVFQVTPATPTPTATPTAVGQDPNAWQNAQNIGLGMSRVITISNAYDVNWLMFYSLPTPSTVYIRAIPGPGMGSDITLYEGTGYYTGLRDEQAGNCLPADGGGALLDYAAHADTIYFVKLFNPLHTTGTYTVAVRSTVLTCSSPLVAAPSGSQFAQIQTATGTDSASFLPIAIGHGAGLAAPILNPRNQPVDGELRAPQAVVFTIVIDIKPGSGQ